MKSYEALQLAIKGKTIEFARKLGLSTILVNKWQEPHTDFTDSGAYNPLDRIEVIIEEALRQKNPDALAPIWYLAERFNLVIIPLPKINEDISEISDELLKTIKEFGDLAKEASAALQDGRIDRIEAKKIDKEAWELIRQVACFIEAVKKSIK